MQLHLVPPKADKVQSMRETTVCQSSTEGKLLPLSAARPGPLQSAGLPILVADAEVVTVAVPPSAASFLLSFPSCPYTTSRTHGGGRSLLFWGLHLERLAQTAQIMQAAGRWEGAEEGTTPEQLHRLIQPSLEVALRQATLRLDSATTHELSVTVLLLPGSGTRNQSGNAVPQKEQLAMEALNTESPNQWRDSGRNESASHLSDSGFSPPNQQAASLTPDSPTKLSNNDLATEQMGEERSDRIRGGVKACVYVSGYEAPLGGRMPQRTTVAVAGPGREMPAAKDSSWALDRQPLEASKPPGVGEVLLSDNGEALLEGLLTNFFVVRRAEGGANRASLETHAETSPSKQHKLHERMKTPSGHKEGFEGTNDAEKVVCAATDGRGKEGKTFSANSRWQNLVVQTAALEEGVLPGVVRRAVLSLCEEWGVDVSLEAPRISDRSTWVEAFVTSSVRIVQPVASVRWRPGWRPESGHVAASDWQEHQLPKDSPFCRALWDALLTEEWLELEASSMNIANLCRK